MSKQKKIIIITTIVIVVILGILAGIYFSNKKAQKLYPKMQFSQLDTSKTVDKMTDVEKRIAGIDSDKIDKKSQEINEKDYSKTYKEFKEHIEEEKSEVIPRKQEVPFEKLEEIKEKLNEEKKDDLDEELTIKGQDDNDTTDTDEIPKRFNLADKIDIKVENQGSYGLCWDFASIKSLETHLALKNLGNYDLSEMHLDYIESSLMYGYRTLHQGGGFSNFEDYIAESGVVLEEDVPYREVADNKYLDLVDVKKVLDVTETVNFPSIYKDEYSKYTEEEITDFRNTVKRHIMTNGGLYCTIATPDYGTKYFNYSTGAECFLGDYDDLSPGREFHAMTIVGWDDNYPKENFNSGMRPTKDGAYIVLNSWGTGFGNEGYYYFSYEDKYIEDGLSGIVSTSLDHAYKISDIKNEAIQNYLRTHFEHLFIKQNGEEYVTKNILSNIYYLDLSNSNITSLDGIEIFQDAYYIDISNNHIRDLSPLAKLTSISTIDASNNDIVDVSSLANMESSSIYSLNLSNNKIKDVSALASIQNEALALNISNNPGITGYDKLDKIFELNISGCNITDISNLKNFNNLSNLIISNTSDIKNLNDIPEHVNFLDISNCGINSIPVLNNELSHLNISNNNLKSLDGIESYTNLYSLILSGNPITDWSALKNLSTKSRNYEEGEFEYSEDFYGDYMIINAENCNIEDITIFNDLNVSAELYLQNNKIKNVSQFSNDKILLIDLTNNKNITGLEGLSGIYRLFLDNCNISDLNEILKLKNVDGLSLENNQLTDISGLSKLDSLSFLSLSGNKGLKGLLSNPELTVLNVSNCNLDDNFDFSNLSNLSYVNLSNNPNLKNLYKMLNYNHDDYMTFMIDTIDGDQYEMIKNSATNKTTYLNCSTINYKYEISNNETKINLKDNKYLRQQLMKSISHEHINATNGHLNKNGYIIDVDDTSKDSVELKFSSWYSNSEESTIKFSLHPSEESSLDTNTTNEIFENVTNATNDVDDNTSNNIVNNIENNVTNETTNNTDTIENTITNDVNLDNTITNGTNSTVEDTQNVVNSL